MGVVLRGLFARPTDSFLKLNIGRKVNFFSNFSDIFHGGIFIADEAMKTFFWHNFSFLDHNISGLGNY